MIILRFYNNNKIKIWLFIFAVTFLLAVLQVINSATKKSNEILINMVAKNIITGNTITSDNKVGNTSIREQQIKSPIISEFLEYCNSYEIERAYSLLSEECKELFYPEIDTFINNYYSKVFYEHQSYKLENLGENTYEVIFMGDMIANGESVQRRRDCYTAIKDENGIEKLNINNYIGRYKIGGVGVTNKIKFEIPYKDVYKDYEIYTIIVTNGGEQEMLIDSKGKTGTVYGTDKNEMHYNAFLNEVDIIELKLRKNEIKTLNIKFNKIYNENREIKVINFVNIVLGSKGHEKVCEISIGV